MHGPLLILHSSIVILISLNLSTRFLGKLSSAHTLGMRQEHSFQKGEADCNKWSTLGRDFLPRQRRVSETYLVMPTEAFPLCKMKPTSSSTLLIQAGGTFNHPVCRSKVSEEYDNLS